MNTKIILGALVVALGVGGFFYWKSAQKVEAPTTVDTVNTGRVMPTTSGGMKSLRDLFSLGISQKCTFTTSAQGGKNEGTVYVAGGRMRGDFSSHVDASGKILVSHMISDGKEMRMWQDGEVMGFLLAVPTVSASTQTASSSPANTPINYNTPADYHCDAWAQDEAFFKAPTTVTFRSMTEMMRVGGGGDTGMMEGGEPLPATSAADLKSAQCKICTQAPNAAAQTQCKLALKCQ